MNISMRIFCAAGLCLAGLVCAEERSAPTQEEIVKWVNALGAEAFEERTAAERKLIDAGAAARAELEKAARSDDAEVKTRATRLLGTLKTEPILRKMEEAFGEAKSMGGTMTMSMTMMGITINTEATFKTTADGKRFVMDLTVNTNGQQIPSHVVGDGKTMWTELTLPGDQGKVVQKYSMKTLEKLGSGNQNPLAVVREMRNRYTFIDAREEMLGETAVYVLDGRLRPGFMEQQAKKAEEVAGPQAAEMVRTQLGSMDKVRLFVTKKEMMFVKSEMLDSKGNVIVDMEVSKIKKDIKIDEAELSYTPPEGVRIMDMEEEFRAARDAGGAAGRDGER